MFAIFNLLTVAPTMSPAGSIENICYTTIESILIGYTVKTDHLHVNVLISVIWWSSIIKLEHYLYFCLFLKIGEVWFIT